jgi:hypothetical protein
MNKKMLLMKLCSFFIFISVLITVRSVKLTHLRIEKKYNHDGISQLPTF